MRFDIERIRNEVVKKGAIINAPNSLLIIHTSPQDDGTPYIELTERACFYVSSERGQENFRDRIEDFDQLLYRLFQNITARIASDYELENRIESQDARRLLFQKKLELLGKISKEWEIRESKEIEKTLSRSPYDDFSSARASFCRNLRKKGVSESEIRKKAYEEYPAPQGIKKDRSENSHKTFWENHFNL